MDAPKYCRPEAYYFFVEQLPVLETTPALVRAVMAVAMHALDDADVATTEGELTELAESIKSRLRSREVPAVLAHLHEVLFEEMDFSGNVDDYYNPLNSYLPTVLESHRGLPILLALIYKAVGEKVGLEIDGLGTPGHFLVRVRDPEAGSGYTFIDPFHRGLALSRNEAWELLARVNGRPLTPGERYLAPCTHIQWTARVLANLYNYFSTSGHEADCLAMNELLDALRNGQGRAA